MGGAAERQEHRTVSIRVGESVYPCRLFRDLSTAEYQALLALQVEMCVPDLPSEVLDRLTFDELLHIAEVANEREHPPLDGEPIPIRARG